MQQPCSIRNVVLNRTHDKIIVFYQELEENDFVKFFRLEGKRFLAYEDAEASSVQEFSNICIDRHGKIFEVLTEIKTKKYQKPEKCIEIIRFGQKLVIKIPSQVLPKKLFDQNNYFKKVIISPCQSILMCGRVILKISKENNSLEKIGCIVPERQASQILYKFKSLLDPVEKKQILEGHPIKFKKPLFPKETKSVIYVSTLIDELSGETSVIHLNPVSFSCFELYQSKFRIVHLSLLEIHKNSTPVLTKGNVFGSEKEEKPVGFEGS